MHCIIFMLQELFCFVWVIWGIFTIWQQWNEARHIVINSTVLKSNKYWKTNTNRTSNKDNNTQDEDKYLAFGVWSKIKMLYCYNIMLCYVIMFLHVLGEIIWLI